MHKFRLSDPALRLMAAAGSDPFAINRTFEQRVKLRQETHLRPPHPQVTAIRRATAIPLISISRRNRNLLIEVEGQDPFWRYVENGRCDCRLVICGLIPDTVTTDVIGQPLSRIADIPFLAETRIARMEHVASLTEIVLKVRWRSSQQVL